MAHKIQEIAPLLAEQFIDFEADSTIVANYDKLLHENADRIGLYQNYFPLLHDSWFLDTTLTENKYSIILNDYTRYLFSLALIERKELEIDPGDLVFLLHGDFVTSDVTFNRVDNNGVMIPIEPTTIDVYLYEQILEIDKEQIELGLVVWKNYPNKQGEHILILMGVKDIVVTEYQDKSWSLVFGNSYDDYLAYFKSQLQEGRYLSDQELCAELIDEFDRKKAQLRS